MNRTYGTEDSCHMLLNVCPIIGVTDRATHEVEFHVRRVDARLNAKFIFLALAGLSLA